MKNGGCDSVLEPLIWTPNLTKEQQNHSDIIAVWMNVERLVTDSEFAVKDYVNINVKINYIH